MSIEYTVYSFSNIEGGREMTFHQTIICHSDLLLGENIKKWEGKEVTNSVFMGEFESSDSNTNPDVYFYYKGSQVHHSKMRTQDNNMFGIPYRGPVDMIYVNIVPYTASTFSLIRPWFGKNLKFDV